MGVLPENRCAAEPEPRSESAPGLRLVSQRIQIEDFGAWHNAVVKSYIEERDVYEVVYPVDGSTELLVLKEDGTACRRGDADQVRWRIRDDGGMCYGSMTVGSPPATLTKSAKSNSSASTNDSDISMTGMIATAKASKEAWNQSRAGS